jgi:stalled ribosome alternative rescue factor ArfA
MKRRRTARPVKRRSQSARALGTPVYRQRVRPAKRGKGTSYRRKGREPDPGEEPDRRRLA